MSEEVKVTPVRESEAKMPPFGMSWRDWLPLKAQLAKKKSNVMAGVDTIPKNGYNEEDNYWFARDADINDCLRTLIHDNGLSFDIEFVNRHVNNGIMEVMLEVTWTDCDTGYFETRRWLAAGFDKVDKAIYKAYTGGAKYFLMRTFLMSQGDTDPEISERKRPPFEQKKTPPKQAEPEKAEDRKEVQPAEDAEGNPEPTEKPEEPQETAPEKTETTRKTRSSTKNTSDAATDKREDAKEAGDTKTQEEPEKAAESKPEPLDDKQKDQVRLHVKTLTMFATGTNEEAAKDAIFTSLGCKPELKEWWGRISKEKSNQKRIEAFTKQEASKALEYLALYIKQKEGKRNA